MDSWRIRLFFAVVSVSSLLSGCHAISLGDSSVSALDPFGRPPQQSEPEIQDDDSAEASLSHGSVVKTGKKKDGRTSLPVTELRPTLTESDLQ